MVHIRNLSGAGGQSWLEDTILGDCVLRYIAQCCHTMRQYPLKAPGNIHNICITGGLGGKPASR